MISSRNITVGDSEVVQLTSDTRNVRGSRVFIKCIATDGPPVEIGPSDDPADYDVVGLFAYLATGESFTFDLGANDDGTIDHLYAKMPAGSGFTAGLAVIETTPVV